MKNINDDIMRTATLSLTFWWKRQALSREMQNLDDRLLEDIGLGRYEIAQVVEHTYPRVGLRAGIVGLFTRFKNYLRNHRAAQELSNLDDRMLADMGIFRSDISSIADGHYPERAERVQNAVNDDHVRAA